MSNGKKFVGLAAMLAVASCASEAPPRSYVQPNIIKKSDLTGTWYYIQTAIDAPPTSGTMFMGNSSELLKIRFDIQEDFLYARRSYEWIVGSSDAATAQGPDYKGDILAAWKISSQFDIIRDFNSTTGEQTNKIIEDQSRPWDQREFIRVDWSQNLTTDLKGIGLEMFFSEEYPQIEPISYWVSDPTSPDALHMERAQSDNPQEGFKAGEMTYLDIVDQVVVTPPMRTISFEENGVPYSFTIPTCPDFGLNSYDQRDCTEQTYKIRHAFAKIGPNHDYEARNWDGLQMNLFGIWDVGLRRLTYNRQYGVTNSGFDRHAARFNIWQKSYCAIDPVNPINNSPTAQCLDQRGLARKDASGNVVTVAQSDSSHPCYNLIAACMNGDAPAIDIDGVTPLSVGSRIPMDRRTARVIPYYAEGSRPIVYQGDPTWPDGFQTTVYPDDLYGQFQEVINQWNQAMKVAVMDAANLDINKYNQAMAGTQGFTPRPAKYTSVDQVPDVFIACHNPVRQAPAPNPDNPACISDLQPLLDANGNPRNDNFGNPILMARQGDPRRSNVFWVNEQQNAGPLGYGPPLFDPETGETISGQAYIYGAALDTYAARSRDLMLLQNGDLANDEFVNGDNVSEWVSKHKFGVLNKPAPTFDPKQVMAMSKAMDFGFAKAFSKTNGYPSLDISSNKALYQSMQFQESMVYNNYFAPIAGADSRDDRIASVAGTPLETMGITAELMASGGVSPLRQWSDLSEQERTQVSPVRQQALRAMNTKAELQAETVGLDFASFDDPGLGQRLSLIKQKYCPGLQDCQLASYAEQIRQDLRQQIFLAVTLHEVGHNMGCRHNFRGSYDAMNYQPDKLDKTGAVTEAGYWHIRSDAATMAGGDANTFHPRYLNVPGGAVTQYESDHQVREYQYSSIMDYGAEFNSDLHGLGLYDKALIKYSYANALEVFTDAKPDPATMVKIGALHQGQTAFGLPSPLGAGASLTAIPYHTYPQLFNSGWQGIYKRADVSADDVTTQSLDMNGDTVVADTMGRPMVPYYFCSDEFAGNLTCQRFDAGADPYEQATDLISRYQNFYLYNNFKRDRQSFRSTWGYVDRIYGRYFEMLREQLTWYVLLRADFQGFLTDNAIAGFGGDPNKVNNAENQFFVDENGWGSFTVAVNLGFDLLGSVIDTPTAGLFYKYNDPNGQTYWKHFNDQIVQDPRFASVDYIDGKYVDTTWDFQGCGYYWADECQTRIGYLIDKITALNVLSESQAYFTGRDTATDVRKYAIGYIVPYKKQIETKFASIFAGDYQGYGPVLQQDSVTGNYDVIHQPWSMPDPGAYKGMMRGEPATGFTIQLWAGLYGLATFPTTYDHEFIDTTQIFVVGNGEAPVSDSYIMDPNNSCNDPANLVSNGGDKEWFVFSDPMSGKTYAAHSVPRKTLEVLDTNAAPGTFTTKTAALPVDQGAQMLGMLKQVSDALQAAQALDDSDPTKSQKVANAQDAYEQYRENVEVMRSLFKRFGYGAYRTDTPFYY